MALSFDQMFILNLILAALGGLALLAAWRVLQGVLRAVVLLAIIAALGWWAWSSGAL